MEHKTTINVAVIDTCAFTAVGLAHLTNGEPNGNKHVNFSAFPHLDTLYKSDTRYDLIVYDPLNTNNIVVNVENDVSIVRKHQPHAKVYIYSNGVGFLKLSQVDGMFSKRISLHDLKILWLMTLNKLRGDSKGSDMNITVTDNQKASYLTNEEVSVLRGYSCNLTTRQIASVLGCTEKLIYFYKKSAITKLQAARGPMFYQQIRCILN